MANRINISFGTIFKRSSCLNSVSESKSVDVGKSFSNLDSQIKSLSKQNTQQIGLYIKKPLMTFMESISNSTDANKHYREPIYLMQEFNKIDSSISNYILEKYTGRILPYVEDLSRISETLSRYDITEEQRNAIIESATKYITADRILINHDRISKRFNIAQEISKVKSKGLKFVIESCCSMIDTYSIPSYAKMNLCFEEIGYLLDKEGIKFDRKEFVEGITEYFLLRSPNISSRDLKGYRTVLSENCYLTEQDISNVEYIVNTDNIPDVSIKGREVADDSFSVRSEIHKFLINQDKSMQDLENTINNSLRSSILDIRYNLNNLLWLIWDVYKSGLFNNSCMEENIPTWLNNIIRYFSNNINGTVSKDDITIILDNLCKFKDVIFATDDNYESICISAAFKRLIFEFETKLKTLNSIVYSESNLKAIDFVNNESVQPIPLNEYKIFKFHNLVKCCMNLDKYLQYKSKKIYDKGSKKIRHTVRKIKDILFDESTNIFEYIGEDSKVDICVAEYYLDEEYIDESITFFEEVCKEFNDKLVCENSNSLKCYYIVNPGVAEIHLKESTPIISEDIDWKLVRESNTEYLDIYIDEIAYFQACMECIENMDEEFSFDKYLEKFNNSPNITTEHFEIAMEALSLLDIEQESVNLFSESFINYRYSTALLESVITEAEYKKEITSINRIHSNWVKENNVPLDIQIEAIQILNALLEAGPTKPPQVKKPQVGKVNNKEVKDDPKTPVDETRKNPFAGINLNSMKLYLEGLKQKMKKMSSKEREISRNMDNNYRRFVKSIKDALISDRREAIIKGSVIPSFSKCVKIAIGLAGTGIVTGNPLVPLLIAVGGFAVSKRLTQKERILLLDEIETELEVVEKEISMAESKNQMKKYRALLKYKKDLQRQYQRIRYNIRVGKDILPGSTSGVKNYND